ncbi:hypothetical protein EMPS_10658 [Entomortierella parvispora]|uniref:Uncharacterized protein n=1 Tax=Entomortierella parvispora TaxID=205924 RepID=A0A9P3HKB1_9FUNG|nr:hypothetical protein EMPS_10658 [Entomortierella parvispora]
MPSTPPSDDHQPRLPHGAGARALDASKDSHPLTGTKPSTRGDGAAAPPTVPAGTGTGTVAGTGTEAGAETAAGPSSPETISPYSSWSVPSLENLFSSRRASSFGLRYNFASSAQAAALSGNSSGGRISPAPSGMSSMMDGASGSSMQSKARKMSVHMSESVTSVLNDVSLVLYRVNEHIHKKVPILVQEKRALSNLGADVERANQDMEDARLTLTSLRRISELGTIEALVKRALVASQSQ